MWTTRRLLKLGVVAGATVGTVLSLRANQYDVNSIGIVRLGRAATTVFGIALHYKTTLYASNLDVSSPEYLQLKSEVHRAAAGKLLALCRTNKGVYIKVGQHIGALDYLLPQEYVQTMKVLHSRAPCSSLKEVEQVLREDLKRDPLELFDEFEPEPLGTASLAQVHRAKLKDGTVLAVKVQHPYVKGNSIVDMKTMEVLVKLVAWAFPDFKFLWLVDETKRNIPLELDFTQEGHNAEKFRDMFQHFSWLKVPKIHWELSTSRVLAMEYLEGGQVNDLGYIRREGIDPYEVSDKLGQLYSQMIFLHGFVHSDPHPGNVLVRRATPGPGAEVVLLDHGLYAVLSSDFRCDYAKLWLSILDSDREGMKRQCEKLGVGDLYGLFACMVAGRTWDAIVSGIDRTKFSSTEKEEFSKLIPSLLPQISDVLSRVNRQMLLILRTNDLMRGVEHTLGTHSRKASFLVMSKCCIRSVYGERLKECSSFVARWMTLLARNWALMKLSLYYAFLSVRGKLSVSSVA
ncbi:aarF domain-containing kinase 1 [Bacillus rossius redtenbacheri]|uniref:aarF domain-containing kinase 1 n=1 Tax=Bacillus rossius redtenbacheri TaxID=93214 RepID=UPI002FDE0FAE